MALGIQPLLQEQEMVQKEADLARLFRKHVSGPVMPYFGTTPLAKEWDQVRPLGDTSFGGKVDTEIL
jgi:hypothetical protein